MIRAAQYPVDWWTRVIHSLWTRCGSTGCAASCPRATHRLGPVVPSNHPLLHTSVHCSATQRSSSPRRVKGVTPSCRIGLWESWVELGTVLCTSGLSLCTGCAELFVLHRHPRFSTGSAHRHGGQKPRSGLGKRSYPPYPQALLLLPTRERAGFVSKRVLCTTRGSRPDRPSSRLDPEGHLLSVRCVRLVSGVLPRTGAGDTGSDDEGGRRRAGDSRRRQR